MIRLTVTGPKGQQSNLDVQGEQATIGKADDNTVVLRGFTVGKRQATLQSRANGLFLEGHGGLSTTEVNGKVVEKEHGPLIPGDVISIAGYNIKIVANGGGTVAPAAPKAAPPPAPP